MTESKEACDDGNNDDGDGCSATCASNETCGNDILDSAVGEVCDDNNTVSGDGCSDTCRSTELCGNGVVDWGAGEVCDDGNVEARDGCSANCRSDETCGNGTTDDLLGELCDDAGDSAACDVDCTPSECGDSYINVVAGEECDTEGDAESCDMDCTTAVCGDGHVNSAAGELCDDWNGFDGDACSATCQYQVHMAAGQHHNCIRLAAGNVRCWGSGGNGRLGYPDATSASLGDDEGELPARAGDVDVGGAVAQIAAGLTHTCAVMTTGAVRCWGQGLQGQLGYGNVEDVGYHETPASVGVVDIGGLAVQVAAGRNFTCALLDDGTVRCWGNSAFGKLGLGPSSGTIGDDEAPGSQEPVNIGGPVAQIATGRDHACALLTSRTVRCWGRNHRGQLGYNHTNDITEDPANAGDVDVGGTVVQISAGFHHTCALLDNGALRCWGNATHGRLGYSNEDDIGDDEHPSAAGDIALGGPAVQVAAGAYHTCALLASGQMHCWGDAGAGQLGYGNTDPIGDDEHPVDAGYVDVGGPVASIAAGQSYTCVMLESGDVRCFGDNQFGKLGYGHTDRIGDDETPGSVSPVFVEEPFIDVGMGDYYTCGIRNSGAVQCWGLGGAWLGYGPDGPPDVNENLPRTKVVDVGGQAVQIGLGEAHTCAVLADGSVRCWGIGEHGRLGYGNTATIGDDETPASVGLVDVGGPVAQVVAGQHHTCARLTDGRVRCWGSGASGCLGYGNTVTIGDDETPSSAGDVPIGGTVIELAAQYHRTCALLDTGAVRCWGVPQTGPLGYGDEETIGDDETPEEAGDVNLSAPASAITAGHYHICARLTTGAARCWGSGDYGVLGYGNTNWIGGIDTPLITDDIDVGANVLDISAGWHHTCAVLDGNTVHCWGQGYQGQLGYGNTDDIGDDEFPGSVGEVQLGVEVAQIASGFITTCARTTAGAIRCWGQGLYGQLGNGSTENIGDDEFPTEQVDTLTP